MLDRLTRGAFVATAQFDRMGMVLDGQALTPLRIDMPSEPAVRGALQVDGDGRLSLLTADHQTTGGYPRIAVAVDPDIDRIAQLPAGTPLRFEVVEPAQAVALTRAAARQEADWLARVAGECRKRGSLMTANLTDGMVVAHHAGT
jgi:allophanate hydrolase